MPKPGRRPGRRVVGLGSFPAVPASERRGRSTSISGLPSREPKQAYLAILIRRPDDDVLDLLSRRIQARFQIRCAATGYFAYFGIERKWPSIQVWLCALLVKPGTVAQAQRPAVFDSC
jgi:hypothetical protein